LFFLISQGKTSKSGIWITGYREGNQDTRWLGQVGLSWRGRGAKIEYLLVGQKTILFQGQGWMEL
jgi:hypothetical protein